MLATDPKDFPLALRSIYMRKSETYIKDTFDPFIPNQRLSARFRNQKATLLDRSQINSGAAATSPTVYTFLTQFDFGFSLENGASSDDDADFVAEVKVIFAVDYLLHGEKPSEELLEAWGQTSALVHCWPYWREYCQSAIGRMSLPMVLMPMLDIQAVMSRENPELTKATKRTRKKIATKEARNKG